MKPISTKKAPGAIGPYSQAIQAGDFVYTSGQLGLDPQTGAFPEGGIKEQARQSLNNVKAILEEAGLSMANVVNCRNEQRVCRVLHRALSCPLCSSREDLAQECAGGD